MLKRVLMCSPDYFEVKYQINPWMKIGETNSSLAYQQWQNLVEKYRQDGIIVETVKQVKNQPDMVFTADQGLIIPSTKTILLSNFKYPQRQGETKFFAEFFKKNGFKLEVLPEKLKFEGGGETLHFKDNQYFIGQGFRNSEHTFEYINKKFNLEFIPLELINEKFYHLDTCFFILNKDTCFYYPPAFSQKSQNLIKQKIPNTISLSEDEVMGFSANSVVSNKTVFTQINNPTFSEKLRKMKYKVVEVDVSEFIKAGGGIHCLTFEMER